MNQMLRVENTTQYGDVPTEPRVGSLKYVYGEMQSLSFPTCITNKTFDGWVYVKDTSVSYGAKELNLPASEIVKLPAYATLGNGNAQAPAIVVPPLTDFVKPAGGPVTSNGFSKKPSHIGNQSHSHQSQTISDVSVVFGDPKERRQVNMSCIKKDYKYAVSYRSGTNKTSDTYRLRYDISVDLSSVGKFDCSTDDAEDNFQPEPPHSRLLAMVYIGRRTKPYQTVKTDSLMDPSPVETRTPYIGEFRLFAEMNGKTTTQIKQMIVDGTFDGWVHADGVAYNMKEGKYDFSEAYSHFVGRNGAFIVPKITSFVRMDGNPGLTTDFNLGYQPYNNSVPSHVHGMSFDSAAGQTVSAFYSVQTWRADSGSNSNRRLLHTGFYDLAQSRKFGIVSLSTDSATLKVEFDQGGSTGGGNEETYPSHYVLPGMVYIGVKKA